MICRMLCLVVQTRAVTSVQINGPALRVIRERTGISCSALARRVGTDVSFLARVERGEKRGLSRTTWERVAYELEIDGRAILVDPYGSTDLVARVEPMATNELHSTGTPRAA